MKATPMTYGTFSKLLDFLEKDKQRAHAEYLVVCDHLEGSEWGSALEAAHKYRTERWRETDQMIEQLRYAAAMSNANGNAECRQFWGVDEALAASANLDTLKPPTQTQSA